MNEFKNAGIRKLLSGMFGGLANRNRTNDIYFDLKTIRLIEETETKAMRGEESLVETITEKDLVDMCFGC